MNTGSIMVHWDHIANPFLGSPDNVAKSCMKFAIAKLEATTDEAYGTKGIKHFLAQPVASADASHL